MIKMATMEKLMKALEALNVIQPPSSAEDSILQKKKEVSTSSKEKIQHCCTVADAICSPILRSSGDFPKVLGLAVDTFLLCCDDENSDVRLMADECFNRTIKTLLNTHLGRLLVELFKEIKKNGSARSLRAALSRFGDICHLMRPQKCRPYTVNLIPSLAKICQRKDEESIQETLSIVFTKLMPVLGQFTNDKEIKILLKAFIPNLTLHSAIIRRAAATSLTYICQYSRRPASFFSWLTLALFDLILPAQEERPSYHILGVLLCFRHVVAHFDTAMSPATPKSNSVQTEDDFLVTKEHMLKVYEITLHFISHHDHNVVTAALETLYQLLKCAPIMIQQIIVSSSGITKSLIYEVPKLNRAISESQGSVPFLASIDETVLEDEQDLFISNKKDDSLFFHENGVSSVFDSDNDTALNTDGESEDVPDNVSLSFPKKLVKRNVILKDDADKRNPLEKGASDDKVLDSDDEFLDYSASTPSPCSASKSEFKVVNIGKYTDLDVPLKYCTRLLCSSFLLSGIPSGCTSDRNIRISVKSLALGCLSNIFVLYPSAFFLNLYLEDSEDPNSEQQSICDVVIYASHPDPHIRGQIAVMIGNLLAHGLKESGGCWCKFASSETKKGTPTLGDLLSKLIRIVQDDSSVASKLGLIGLKECLKYLLNSVDAYETINILEALIACRKNSYWLFKVELADLISTIDFRLVDYLEKKYNSNSLSPINTFYQDEILYKVLIPLLGDEDVRVRHATAHAFTRLVSKLFFAVDHPNKDPVIAVSQKAIDSLLDLSLPSSIHLTLPLVHALVKPFSLHNYNSYDSIIDSSLSRILNLLMTTMQRCTNKHLIFGCCQALSLLSEEFLVTIYPETWTSATSNFKLESLNCEIFEAFLNNSLEESPNITPDFTTDLICHVISLVSNTSLCLNLIAHQHVLQLAGNLLCGVWYKNFIEIHKKINNIQHEIKSGPYVSFIVGKIFQHIMKLLNIFVHVLQEQYPLPLGNRSALSSLPNAPILSPIKRKSKGKDETVPGSSNILKGSPNRVLDKGETEKERTPNSKVCGQTGQFFNSSLYMKLFEILKGAHSSYKISMDFQSSEKFCQLLRCALDLLGQILEISDSNEMGKNAEEILGYMKLTMTIEASSTVQCIRQLLKCIFGTNLVVLCQDAKLVLGHHNCFYNTNRISSIRPGLYHSIISYPYTDFTHSLAEKVMNRVSSDENDELVSFRCLNWAKRGDRLTNVLKTGSKGEKANLASHIRLFENVVIRSLQQYTISSDITLQCQVLDLLAQLVQLRVNYCLLDADQIFISYVIKQFEFIEEGQIIKADILVPRIFNFLILLSYERFHSKPIISVPKILQLCDGLIASGQPPEKYVIPALQPVIEDLFILRSMNKMDSGKELDAQREVLISTLFKLVNYPQVLELFFLIVNHSRQEGEDKWRKTSRQIVDIILPLLARQQIQIQNQQQLNVLHKLLESVASNVFRPVDILLKALFSPPKDLNIPANINRWMCMILSILRVLISQANEEAVLSRLADMGITIKIYKLNLSPSLRCEKEQAEHIFNGCTDSTLPSVTFARFLFQVLGVVVESLCNFTNNHSLIFCEHTFLSQQASHLLLYLTHMYQSGAFRRVTTSAMSVIKDENKLKFSVDYPVYYTITEIENMFHSIAPFYPTLVIQWCNILTLLNYDNQQFWSKIIQPYKLSTNFGPRVSFNKKEMKNSFLLPCNLEMVRRGGIILLCDYVCENPNDAVLMTWLIVNHVYDIIELSLETTVQDFISAIHRNCSASGLWIQAIINGFDDSLSEARFLKQVLLCLQKIHIAQSGNLLNFLVKYVFSTHNLLVAKVCDEIACHRIEMLLFSSEQKQICMEDINKFIVSFEKLEIAYRHHKFISLCGQFKKRLLIESPSSTHPLVEPSIQVRHISLNKDWFMSFVQQECFDSLTPAKECAQLLSYLKYEDVLSVMSSKDFQFPILEQCLLLGASLISSNEKYLASKSNDPFLGVTESPGSVLYRAAQSTLLLHLEDFEMLLPKSAKRSLYQHKNFQLFEEDSFWEILYFLVPSTSCFLETHDSLPNRNFPTNSLCKIINLSFLCCEAIAWRIHSSSSVSSEMLKGSLILLDKVLKNAQIAMFVELELKRFCSAISSVHFITECLHHGKIPNSLPIPPKNAFLTEDENQVLNACIKIAALIEWLEKSNNMQVEISGHLFTPLKSVIRGLARIPLVNSFARTPPILWVLGWNPEYSGNQKNILPPPPGEFLQERDVLKQYIYRINLLGWISRQQFEETWMALLGVLSATPVDDTDGKEEDRERIRTSCLAVKSITSLLMQTLLLPNPGNPQNSLFLNQPRDKPLAFQHTKCGKKLVGVRVPIHVALQKLLSYERFQEQILNVNAERVATLNSYSLSQVSLEYLNAAAGLAEDNDDADGSASSNSSPLSANIGGVASFQLREQSLTTVGLDIHSCLHFLLDLYSQWLSPQTSSPALLTLLTEVTKSVISLSDIFMEKRQFEWMLDTFLEVQRIHPAEDEIIAQYLIFGICKAAAVLGVEQDVLDKLKKLLEIYLRSIYLPTRIATLHGFLYLLEQNGRDESFSLLPTATEYIVKTLDSPESLKPCNDNEDHILILWAVAFYIIENYQDDVSDEEFIQKIFNVCLNICGFKDECTTSVYLTVLHGLERLLVAEILGGKEANTLLTLAVERIRSGDPIVSMAALGFFLSCMYIGKSTNMWSNELVPDVSKTPDKNHNNKRQMDAECLLVAMEQVTILFDRVKRGYPFEAETICEILPGFLMEFFPVQEILNKIITEFLSSQQPHPKLMAKVIFEVFQFLHKQSQQEVIHEWVLLSLSNFMQRSPLPMAIWSLTCFLVSATTNNWFQAVFPHIQNRMGKMEESDRVLFCIAGVNFKEQLVNEEQKQAYFNTVQNVAHPNTPYAELLSCL